MTLKKARVIEAGDIVGYWHLKKSKWLILSIDKEKDHMYVWDLDYPCEPAAWWHTPLGKLHVWSHGHFLLQHSSYRKVR